MLRRFSLLLILVFTAAALQAIPVYLFTDPDCESCSVVKEYLSGINKEYPLEIIEFDVFTELPKLRPVNRAFDFVPQEIPIVLIGDEIIEGKKDYGAYLSAVKDFKEDGFGVLLGMTHENKMSAPSFWAVVAGGLVDGVNPCAFSVIIFMVLYLSVSGRRKRRLTPVLLAFGGGVFTAYFLMGLGLRQAVSRLMSGSGKALVSHLSLIYHQML